jgi:hypothetical protein
MKISELREWAAATYGAHSHKEGQVLAALGPIEEWLGSLARQGVNLEVVPAELAKLLPASGMKPLHASGEPPTPLNSGGTSEAGVVEVPLVVPPTLDTSTFVNDTGFASAPPRRDETFTSAVRAPGGVEAPK